MLKEKTDSIWAMMTALFFIMLVIYMFIQDTSAGPI